MLFAMKTRNVIGALNYQCIISQIVGCPVILTLL